MRAMLKRRPSPSMVVALVALFVSLGGVSYGVATGSIDSREIKNNDIRSKDIRNGNLIGKDFVKDKVGGGAIKESSLSTVPGAATLGGLPATAFERKIAWAYVDGSTGEVRASSGGVTARRTENPANGVVYLVNMGMNITGAALVTSPSSQLGVTTLTAKKCGGGAGGLSDCDQAYKTGTYAWVQPRVWDTDVNPPIWNTGNSDFWIAAIP